MRRSVWASDWATFARVKPLVLTAGDLALRPAGTAPGPWLREALADEGDPPAHLPLTGGTDADVAIVGGGYTGLWTAYRLLESDPQLRVVLLEMDVCGSGPSGRNGGFVNSWWDELGLLRELLGRLDHPGRTIRMAVDGSHDSLQHPHVTSLTRR